MNGDLLLIHQAFASKDEPGGTRHFELAKRLVAQGRTFTVIASDVVYQTGKRATPSKKLMTESTTDGVRILRAYTYASLHTSYVARVISFLSFTITSVLVGMRAGRPDVVMGTTPSIFQAVSAWVLSVLHRRPFLLEIRDLWPEFAIDIGLLRNPLLITMARSLESFLYARADHLLVNSPAYRDYLIAKGVEAKRISLVPNGVDPYMFNPDDRAEGIRRRYGVDDRFVVTYAGALGMANDIDVLVDAASLIRDRSDVQILIVGDGKERARLESKVRSLALTNVKFTGPIPKSQMPDILAASDACVAILRNIKMFTTTYPNKVFDYMAAGRPTVLAIDGVIRKVVEAACGGIFVQPGDPNQLAAALIRLADDPQQAKQMGRDAHSYVVQHFNRDDHAREFMNLVSRLAFARATK